MVEFSVIGFVGTFCSTLACFASYAYENNLFTLILIFFVAVIIIWHVKLSVDLCTGSPGINYDYSPERGPHVWPSSGCNQSPINIETVSVEPYDIREPLMWNHYNDLPTKMTLENNGITVILKAQYANNAPTLSGANLLQCYTFQSLCFHWSFWNTEGSEHTIDYRCFPMEMQATHQTQPLLSCVQIYSTLMLTYLFEISAHNQYLDPIILNLCRIRQPNTVVEIRPFPLSWLCQPFKTEFFSYGGSMSTPPCNEGVEWFINPQTLAISESQIMEFRSLLSSNGTSRIMRNSRPVQNLNNNRTVHINQYYPPSSSRNSSGGQHLSGD